MAAKKDAKHSCELCRTLGDVGKMAPRPMLTMMVALQPTGAPGPTAEVPLDVFIEGICADSYLALRAGSSAVLLTECEARALAIAIKELSIRATAFDSARDHIGKASAGRE